MLLKNKLNETRNGVTIPGGVQMPIFCMVAETLATKEQVETITAEEIGEIARAAYESIEGCHWNVFLERRMKRWASSPSTPTPPPPTADSNLLNALRAVEGTSGQEADGADLLSIQPLTFGQDVDLDSEAVIGKEWAAHCTNDKKIMGLESGAEIIALACSAEIGSRLAGHSFRGVVYGTEIMTQPAIKDARKHSTTPVYTKLIASETPSARAVEAWESHLAKLARSYSRAGRPIEATIILGFVMAAKNALGRDPIALFEYLREYRREFANRAFPREFDYDIAARARNFSEAQSDGGSSKEEQKKHGSRLASIESKLAALEKENGNLKKELKETRENFRRSPGAREGGDKRACFHCGETGHLARNCPNRERKGEEGDDK